MFKHNLLIVNSLKGNMICKLIKTKLVYKFLFSIMAVLSNFTKN